MGQLNISRITSTQSIITPPQNVDGIYNDGGTFYQINDLGSVQPLNSVKQIAVTISAAEFFDLYTTPKVLVPPAGNDVTNVFLNGFIEMDLTTPFVQDSMPPLLYIFEGGTEETFIVTNFWYSSGMYRIVERHDPGTVGTQSATTYTKNNAITLTSVATYSAGTASATVYLSYAQFNDNLLF